MLVVALCRSVEFSSVLMMYLEKQVGGARDVHTKPSEVALIPVIIFPKSIITMKQS